MTPTSTTDRSLLSDGSRLLGNGMWNMLGELLPLLATVIAVPLLISRLGDARFGVFFLTWSIAGFAGLFDLGVGRAMTRFIAERRAAGDTVGIGALIGTGFVVVAAMGLVVAAAFVVASPMIAIAFVDEVRIHGETVSAMYVLALSIPAIMLAAVLRGVLEGHERFGVFNAIRIPTNVSLIAVPAACSLITANLVVLVAAMTLVRYVSLLGFALASALSVEAARRPVVRKEWFGPLLGFGGWLTVSNTVGTLTFQADRYIVGAMLGVSVVTYYASPQLVVLYLAFISGAIASVLVPAMTMGLAKDANYTRQLMSQGVRLTFTAVMPPLIALSLLAEVVIGLWLGEEYVAVGAPVMRWTCVSLLFVSLAMVPAAFLQAAHKPHVLALYSVAELPLFALFLWWIAREHGVVAVALVSAGRSVVQAVFMYGCVMRGGDLPLNSVAMQAGALGVLGSVVLVMGFAPLPTFWMIIVTIVMLCVWFAGARLWLLTRSEWGTVVGWCSGALIRRRV